MSFSPDVPNVAWANIQINIDPYWMSLPLVPGSSSNTRGYLWTSVLWGGYALTQAVVLYTPVAEQGITENQEPRYQSEEIIGRAEPFLTWVGQGSNDIAMTWQYAAQVAADNDPTQNTQTNPVYMGRWLQQLSRPLYDPANDQSVEPPAIIIQVGQLLVMRCVVRRAVPHWGRDFVPGTMIPQSVSVDMVLSMARVVYGLYNYAGAGYYNSVPVWNQYIEFPVPTE
jgi:hypothetical protein